MSVCVSTPVKSSVSVLLCTRQKEIILVKSHSEIPVKIPVIIPVTPPLDVYAL